MLIFFELNQLLYFFVSHFLTYALQFSYSLVFLQNHSVQLYYLVIFGLLLFRENCNFLDH